MSKEWLILTVVAGFVGFWRTRRAAGPERVSGVLLPMLLVVVLFAYAETLLLNTRWNWSEARLAPVIGMFHGYPLYSPVESGPINGWLYGPVAAIAWAPAALADSPLPALMIAAGINLFFLLAPLALAAVRAAPDQRATGGLGFVAGAAVLLLIYPTWYMASALNVDALAVGLGLGSCLVLMRTAPPTRKSLAGAALLAALATWTKQTEAPLVVAQLGWLGFVRGRQAAWHYALACGGALLGMAALVFATFNARDVVFNMWTVPSAHALIGGWRAATDELRDLVRYTAALWVPCAIYAAVRMRAGGKQTPLAAPAVAPGLLVIVALCLLPTGIMAAIKIGGDRNSLHSVYYLAAAATVVVAAGWPAARQVALRSGPAGLAATGLSLLMLRLVAGYPQLSMLPPRCLSQDAWLFARERPHGVYLPWNPLATLMAEGRMYHFEYGVLDRIHAHRPPEAVRLRRDLPDALQMIAYPRAGYTLTMVKEYLPEFSLASTTEDWLIYRLGPARHFPPPTPP